MGFNIKDQTDFANASLLDWAEHESEYANKSKDDFTLDNIKQALSRLDNPHLKLRNVIHIAGTNGKGSTTAFVSEILRQSGYMVNTFISPHLIKENERIKLNGIDISDAYLKELSDLCKKKVGDCKLTYFEVITVIAMLAFAESKAEFNVIEVGLGGLRDATNIFPSKLCSIITSLSYDYTHVLGNEIEKIAEQKAGIIPGSKFVVSAAQDAYPKAIEVIKETAEKHQVSLFVYKKDFLTTAGDASYTQFSFTSLYHDIKIKDLHCAKLRGEHQIDNAALALEVVSNIMNETGSTITSSTIKKGLENAYIQGRIEEIASEMVQRICIKSYQNLRIVLDGSHNYDSVAKLVSYIQNVSKDTQKIAIFSCLKDKEKSSMMEEIAKARFDMAIIVPIFSSDRAEQVTKIYQHFVKACSNVIQSEDLNTAFKLIDEKVTIPTDIYIFGSLFLVGDFYTFLNKESDGAAAI